MGTQNFDGAGHPQPTQVGVTQLTAGAVSTSAAGTIAGTTAAGATPTVTIGDCTDYRGNFLLNPVTGGGAQAAGTVAVVRFKNSYAAAPGTVIITMYNETDGNVVVDVSTTTPTASGFDIVVGAALTTAKAYRTQYVVIP